MRIPKRSEKPSILIRAQTMWDFASLSKKFENSYGDSFPTYPASFIVLGALWLLERVLESILLSQQPA